MPDNSAKTKHAPTKAAFVPYTPFRMKAADYGNSPMRKNYGQFGVGSSESPQKVSPLRLGQKGRLTAEKATAESGAATGMSEAIKTQKVVATPTGAPGGAASAGPMFGAQGGSSGGVGMHGDESHQSGGAIGGTDPTVIQKDPTGRPGKDRLKADSQGGAAGDPAGAGGLAAIKAAGLGSGGGPSGGFGLMKGKGKNR